ncbi:MAG: hypothetical protein ACE5FD_10205, partial [Anaerolineae bacterium]
VGAPVVFVDASPARLSDFYRDEYIWLVSQSFAADGNLERARRRLDALEEPDVNGRLVTLLETALRQQKPPDQTRNLAELAQQLGIEDRTVALFAPTPLFGTPTPTATPFIAPSVTPTETTLPTNTPRPTLTPTNTPRPSPSPAPVYRLLFQERVCPGVPAPRIEVITLDALLEPEPGGEALVSWEGGSDRFFTGFKPEQGAGYGDFEMEPGVAYAVMLAAGSPEISGLSVQTCDDGLAGGWRLTFQNLVVGSD